MISGIYVVARRRHDPIMLIRDYIFVTWLYGFRSGQLGGYKMVHHIRGTLARPGGTQYWADQKANFDVEFVQYVDSLARTDGENG